MVDEDFQAVSSQCGRMPGGYVLLRVTDATHWIRQPGN